MGRDFLVSATVLTCLWIVWSELLKLLIWRMLVDWLTVRDRASEHYVYVVELGSYKAPFQCSENSIVNNSPD